MTGEELQALLDQVEQDCGAEVAEPLRRAVRERDWALGLITDGLPQRDGQALAAWGAAHPDVRLRVLSVGNAGKGPYARVELRREVASSVVVERIAFGAAWPGILDGMLRRHDAIEAENAAWAAETRNFLPEYGAIS